MKDHKHTFPARGQPKLCLLCGGGRATVKQQEKENCSTLWKIVSVGTEKLTGRFWSKCNISNSVL